jgi:tetratricopeptide (TPR) repeat protein
MTPRRRLLVLFAAGALAVLLLGGCAPRVRVLRLQPGEIDLPRRTRVAFEPFSGNDGATLQAEIQAGLLRGGHYEVVERQMLDRIIDEQRRVVDGLTRAGEVQAGELLAASALITGEARGRYSETLQSFQETCTAVDSKTGERFEYACVRHVRTGAVDYRASLRLVDVSTGRVLLARPYSTRWTRKTWAYDAEPGGINRSSLFSSCRDEVATRFIRAIAPHTVEEEVVLVTDRALPALEAGNKFAVYNDWAQAAVHYSQAVALATQQAATMSATVRAKPHYALGVALVMQGQYEQGIEQLTAATNLHPSDGYIQMLARARRWASDAARIAKQAEAGEQLEDEAL